MNYKEFAQSVIPGISEDTADWILWEHTPFPLVMGQWDLLPFLCQMRDLITAGMGECSPGITLRFVPHTKEET